MVLDNKDSRNSIGSKDVNKRPIKSIEPNKERKALFILELRDINP